MSRTTAVYHLIKAGAILIGLIWFAVLPGLSRAADRVEACKALATTDFGSVEDAPTNVSSAVVVGAKGEIPAHCLVHGYIWPQVGFELRLPLSEWNGKFMEIGCGGMCGNAVYTAPWCKDVLRRGYACIGTDKGHSGVGGGTWAWNNLPAQFDFGIRATHVGALAGKAIAGRYYGVPPRLAYFMGCSGGGLQALTEAQRFPWDFRGIIASDPAINLSNGVALTMLWNIRASTTEAGKPLFTEADVELLHKGVLAACDLDDGVKDGVVGNPLACKFDPAKLLCKVGQSSGCLTKAQVSAARKIYGGAVDNSGEHLFIGHAMPGAELGQYAFPTTSEAGGYSAYMADFFRYMLFYPAPGPGWQLRDFNFSKDYKRITTLAAIQDGDNPDLRRFKVAGGKLIITQGWQDSGTPLPLDTIDYYQTVERVMGGRSQTDDFARLFMMPGRNHCGGGPGANAFDFVATLEAWVERGRAPTFMIGAHVEREGPKDQDHTQQAMYVRLPKKLESAKFTRPVYPYPLWAKYRGRGNPNDYRNFVPESP